MHGLKAEAAASHISLCMKLHHMSAETSFPIQSPRSLGSSSPCRLSTSGLCENTHAQKLKEQDHSANGSVAPSFWNRLLDYVVKQKTWLLLGGIIIPVPPSPPLPPPRPHPQPPSLSSTASILFAVWIQTVLYGWTLTLMSDPAIPIFS